MPRQHFPRIGKNDLASVYLATNDGQEIMFGKIMELSINCADYDELIVGLVRICKRWLCLTYQPYGTWLVCQV